MALKRDPLDNYHERLVKVETTVENIELELGDIKRTLNTIAKNISESGKTNWNVVFTGISIVIGLWFAAINPLIKEDTRIDKALEKATEAALIRNDKTNELTNKQFESNIKMEYQQKYIDYIMDHGSPEMEARVSVLESRMCSKK